MSIENPHEKKTELVTPEWWEEYLLKYEDLMWKIARMISGDHAICSLEDNFSDLSIAALESVIGFHKLTGIPVSEMLKDSNFDKYTKTVLWKKKANKGLAIEKKREITTTIPLQIKVEDGAFHGNHGPKTELDPPDPKSGAAEFSIDFTDSIQNLSPVSRKILELIEKHPNILKQNGELNVTELSRYLPYSHPKVFYYVRVLKKRLREMGYEIFQ